MVVERLLHLYELVPGPRFDLAIEQLEGGLGFVFNDVWFRKEGTTLNVEAVGSNGDMTLEAATALIKHAQAAFACLRAASTAFDNVAAAMAITFAVIDDYGMGTIVLCRLVGDQVVWERS